MALSLSAARLGRGAGSRPLALPGALRNLRSERQIATDQRSAAPRAGATRAHGIYGVHTEADRLLGVFSFRRQQRMLELGLGSRPDLTGQRLGLAFVQAGMAFGLAHYRAEYFRLDVALFNLRAIQVYQRAGFLRGCHFTRYTRQGRHGFMETTLSGDRSHSRAITVILAPWRTTLTLSQPWLRLVILRSCSPGPPPTAQIRLKGARGGYAAQVDAIGAHVVNEAEGPGRQERAGRHHEAAGDTAQATALDAGRRSNRRIGLVGRWLGGLERDVCPGQALRAWAE